VNEKKAIIFGPASFGEVVRFYLERDSNYRVAAYAASGSSCEAKKFNGLMVEDFEGIEERYPPEAYHMFVAVGYSKLNKAREKICDEARAKGYKLLTYISSKATTWGENRFGDNVFVFEDNTIQPFVSIGSGTILWSGNHIGHHTNVGSYCFITSHVVVSGNCKVGDRCFLGVNSTIADSTEVANDNLIGPNALIQKNTEPGEAYIADRTKPFKKGSARFFR